MQERPHEKKCPKCSKPIRPQQKVCSECKRLYDKGWYGKNKIEKVVSATQRKRELQEWYRQQKVGKPCFDCGGIFHFACMDFDHQEGFTKKDEVSHMVRVGLAKETIQAEMAKCILLCANCHRLRTFNRLKGKRYQR